MFFIIFLEAHETCYHTFNVSKVEAKTMRRHPWKRSTILSWMLVAASIWSGSALMSAAQNHEPQPTPASQRIQHDLKSLLNRRTTLDNPGDNSGTSGNLVSGFFLGLPFLWSPAEGFSFLPLPCTQTPGGISSAAKGKVDCAGAAAAVSLDGHMVAGSVRENSHPTTPARAARWHILQSGTGPRVELELIGDPHLWSNAWAVSSDGSVVVGDIGPWDLEPLAARWVDGVEQPLQAVGEISSARFCSADGTVAVGWAQIGRKKVLVRWDETGAADVTDPPVGSVLESIESINADGSVVAGVLSKSGHPIPFLWTIDGGFEAGTHSGRFRNLLRPFGRDSGVVLASGR